MKKPYTVIGKVARFYDMALWLSGYEKSVNFFVSQLRLPEDVNINVLDAGCGTGLYSLAILKRYRNAQVTAFDLDARLVARLKEKASNMGYGGRVQTFVADITSDLPHLQKTFDLIVTAGVFEYVPLKQAVSNLSQLLLTGGYFFNSPIRTTVWGNIVARIYARKPYTRKDYLEAFQKDYTLGKIISLPPLRLSSFKEGQFFKKMT